MPYSLVENQLSQARVLSRSKSVHYLNWLTAKYVYVYIFTNERVSPLGLTKELLDLEP